MSSATERLHAMLDERGVEYKDRNVFGKHVFHWGKPFHGAMFTDSGEWTELVVENATPEQAVEATLGRGTCHDTQEDEERFCCSECGSRSHIATEYRKFDEYGNKSEHFLFVDNPRFCPSCGRKVVDA